MARPKSDTTTVVLSAGVLYRQAAEVAVLVPPKMACEGTILVVPKTTLTEIDPARAAETLLYGLDGGTVSANAAAATIAQHASDDMDALLERNRRHLADREDVVAEMLAERIVPPHTASDF